MSHTSIAVLQSLRIIALFGCVAGICYTAYDMGREVGKASEKAKCGDTLHCVPIHTYPNQQAIEYGLVKQCIKRIQEWEDE